MVNFEPIKLLEGKKTGRPSALSDELTKELKLYIEVIREGGGVINTAIVIAAATGPVDLSVCLNRNAMCSCAFFVS